jgi:hypothetical protein
MKGEMAKMTKSLKVTKFHDGSTYLEMKRTADDGTVRISSHVLSRHETDLLRTALARDVPAEQPVFEASY